MSQVNDYLVNAQIDDGHDYHTIEFWIAPNEVEDAEELALSLYSRYHGYRRGRRVSNINIDDSGEIDRSDYDNVDLVFR